MSVSLESRLEARGAARGEVAGHAVARHFGDPAGEYRAVREGAGLVHRADLAQLRLWGRDPVRMLNGLITNDLAGAASSQGVYAAMLTPKGRAIAELRAFARQRTEGVEVLLDLPREALAGTTEHLKKYVPPLFARWEDVSAAIGVLGVYGPRAAERVLAVLGATPPGDEEERFIEIDRGGAPVLVARTRVAGLEQGFDLFAPTAELPGLWEALLDAPAVRPVGFGVLETLRIEAGRPRYGAELTEETIPTEAFQETRLLERAISFTKGCYTGQEVIIRIAHRGHVNRHLRGLLLGDAPAPSPRTPLYHLETGKEIGWTTSAAVSPLLGQTIALGYVRREVEPGAAVRVGEAGGATARVVRLPFEAASP